MPRGLTRPAPVVGVLAAMIAAAGAGIPSYWGDEAASVVSAERTLPSLFGMLGRIDAVHGVYYLFLHVWIGLVGTSETLVRLPSAVAVGFAAAGVVVLGRSLFTPSTGLLAGSLFAVIPEVTYQGAEARSYAFTIAAAVWLTVWLVALVRRGETGRGRWALYAVAVAASLYLFLYLVFLGLVHLAVVIALRAHPAVARRWRQALLLAGVLAAPILIAGISQRGQIAFLARRDYANAASVLVGQWFSTPEFAVVAWALIVIGAAATYAHRSRGRELLAPVLVITVWFAAPTALLLAGNAWITPMYNLRYLTFCTPAVALLMALGLKAVIAAASTPRGRRAIAAAGLGAVVLVAAPAYLAQRTPYAKDGGSDFRQTADVIRANAAPGDAIVFDETIKPSRKPRLALDLYPDAFRGLDDVALRTPFAQLTWLWDSVAPLSAVSDAVRAHRVVWVVETTGRTELDQVLALGYRVEKVIPVHRTVVYEVTKE